MRVCAQVSNDFLHLQVVVTHNTQERYDGVQYGQAAKGRRHVAGALLQDKVLQRALVLLLGGPATPIPGILVIRVVASNLGDGETTGRFTGSETRSETQSTCCRLTL